MHIVSSNILSNKYCMICASDITFRKNVYPPKHYVTHTHSIWMYNKIIMHCFNFTAHGVSILWPSVGLRFSVTYFPGQFHINASRYFCILCQTLSPFVEYISIYVNDMCLITMMSYKLKHKILCAYICCMRILSAAFSSHGNSLCLNWRKKNPKHTIQK